MTIEKFVKLEGLRTKPARKSSPRLKHLLRSNLPGNPSRKEKIRQIETKRIVLKKLRETFNKLIEKIVEKFVKSKSFFDNESCLTWHGGSIEKPATEYGGP